jgi:hypothetical protein
MPGRDVDPRRLLGSVFERVADQVLKELHEVRVVPRDNGKGTAGNACAAFFDCRLPGFQRLL